MMLDLNVVCNLLSYVTTNLINVKMVIYIGLCVSQIPKTLGLREGYLKNHLLTVLMGFPQTIVLSTGWIAGTLVVVPQVDHQHPC